MVFNEIRLDLTITNVQIKIHGCDIVRKDRSRRGGGVCIYLRNCITYRQRNDLVPNDLETVCLQIMKPGSRTFIFVIVYRSLNSHLDFFDNFENLSKAIDDENKELYILDDLNSDLLKDKPNQSTDRLLSLFEFYQSSQLTEEATRITNTSTSLLDYFI